MRITCLLLALAVTSVSWAEVGEDATLLTIGSSGPDAYADGTTVIDGESYALVWRASNQPFAGFRADGSVVDSSNARALCVAPLAKGGRCPETTFVVDSAVLAACGTGGTFGLYLLDSRRWGADGSVRPGGLSGVHGSVLVSETTKVASFVAAHGAAVSSFLASALPEGVAQPQITGIRVEGESIVLTVRGTSAALNYNVSGGEGVGASDVAAAAERPVAGGGGAGEEIELRVPRAAFGDRAFFRIVRNPLEVSE